MPTVAREAAARPLVLSLDIGSSSIRAMVFDATGQDVAGLAVKTTYPLRATDDGGLEADADAVLDGVFQALDEVLATAGPLAAEIAAVASCSLVSNLLGLDAAGAPTTPVYFWGDTRSAPDTAELRRRSDPAAWHDRTGTVIHTSYLAPRFLWLARTAPDTLARTAHWLSLGELLYLRLFGVRACSLSVASWTGLLNRRTLAWDADSLAVLPIRPDQLSPLVDITDTQRGLLAPYATHWPALAQIPWLPTVGDGATANLGSGCTGPDHLAITVGTSGALRVVLPDPPATVPPGLWLYRVDRRHVLLGGALSNGGNVYDWMRQTLHLPEQPHLEAAVAALPPDGHGLTILPFWAGERSPGWAPDATATIHGLRLATSAPEILRAGLEAVAYRFATIHAALAPAVPTARHAIASGAALLHSPAWMQIHADALGLPVIASAEPEASSRGNALLALEVLGTLPDAAACPPALAGTYAPDPARHAIYQQAIARQGDLYARLLPPA